MVLGGGCSTATQAIAGAAYHWNLVTVRSPLMILLISSVTRGRGRGRAASHDQAFWVSIIQIENFL